MVLLFLDRHKRARLWKKCKDSGSFEQKNYPKWLMTKHLAKCVFHKVENHVINAEKSAHMTSHL